MQHYRALQIMGRTLINAGVKRDLVMEAIQTVIKEDRDETIERATRRAQINADREVNAFDDLVEMVLRDRQHDYPFLVDANAFVDHNNEVRPLNAVKLS